MPTYLLLSNSYNEAFFYMIRSSSKCGSIDLLNLTGTTIYMLQFCGICRSPGNAVLPGSYVPLADTMKVEHSGESTSIGQQQFAIPGGQANLPFPQFPNCVFVPFQLPAANGNSGGGSGSNQNSSDSQLEAQKKIIEQQIEVSFV